MRKQSMSDSAIAGNALDPGTLMPGRATGSPAPAMQKAALPGGLSLYIFI
ncbi:MAG: hypothetical protein JST42_22935 [Bacteroidetes bacterium]|nr:hypothetical protein [Bacteroidota bacterium]